MKKEEAMRTGGKILARILTEIKEKTHPGINELEINKWVEQRIIKLGAEVAYYEEDPGFPGAICISVNDELVHGIPEDNILQNGDKVGFDLTIKYAGYYVDAAFSMIVGKGTAATRHLLKVTEKSLYAGIKVVRAGATLGDIGAAVQEVLTAGKLGVITNYVGHGIGEKMHMPPDVPNFGKKGTGKVLKPGDTICIEPMASLGKPNTTVADDGWTVLLKDGSIAAHFEHTVLVTETGHEILTKLL